MAKPPDPQSHLIYTCLYNVEIELKLKSRVYTATASRTLSAARMHGSCMVSRVVESTCAACPVRILGPRKSITCTCNSERVYIHGISWPPKPWWFKSPETVRQKKENFSPALTTSIPRYSLTIFLYCKEKKIFTSLWKSTTSPKSISSQTSKIIFPCDFPSHS